MDRAKIVITPDEQAPAEIDRWERLARECAKLDKAEEQALAEEGFLGESESDVGR